MREPFGITKKQIEIIELYTKELGVDNKQMGKILLDCDVRKSIKSFSALTFREARRIITWFDKSIDLNLLGTK